jgi:hypothetical protein
MTKQKHTTNPTGIREIPKSNVGLRIDRNAKGEIDRLTLESLDLSDIPLDAAARIAVIGKARDTERIFDAGTVENRKPIISEPLLGIDKAHPFHVRILVYDDTDKRILASCERLNPYEAEEGSLQSLLPVEPMSLGEQLWRLSAESGERPVLQVSNDIDAGMLERIRHDQIFQALILPEAIRRSLEHLLRHPSEDDDEDTWQNRWRRYLSGLGIDLPSESGDEEESDDEDASERAVWVNAAVDRIANHLKLKTKALGALYGGKNDHE